MVLFLCNDYCNIVSVRFWLTWMPRVLYHSFLIRNYLVIDINFSFYGTEGSYDLLNQASVRSVNIKRDLLSVILHEITHIIIENPLVIKFSLDHNTKENLVDWILSETELRHILPNYKVQTNYHQPNLVFRKIFDN